MEWITYLWTNPVSSSVGNAMKRSTQAVAGAVLPSRVEVVRQVVMETVPLSQLAAEAGPFVRIAGLLGSSGVMLGAYGAHRTYAKGHEQELKEIFRTANMFHFINTLALFGTPMARCPKMSGTFLTLGTVLFCGVLYHRAFTGEKKFANLAPIGGTFLIIGWLSLAL